MGGLYGAQGGLGSCPLRAAAGQRQRPSRRGAQRCLQMDPHSLPVLAGSRALFGAALPGSASYPRGSQSQANQQCRRAAARPPYSPVEKLWRILQTDETFLLTDQLRRLTVAALPDVSPTPGFS